MSVTPTCRTRTTAEGSVSPPRAEDVVAEAAGSEEGVERQRAERSESEANQRQRRQKANGVQSKVELREVHWHDAELDDQEGDK
ncbi:MAG: hypothetical protein VYE73_14750 [Acidobacteriota bacterium]|nr:hypothetical protein [Acidobacteriota bacterium]